jgi:hypothetical protein
MPKFTVGQKVRSIRDGGMGSWIYRAGVEFKVVTTNKGDDESIRVEFPDGDHWWVEAADFEAAQKFAVGDKVRCLKDDRPAHPGDVWTVVRQSRDEGWFVAKSSGGYNVEMREDSWEKVGNTSDKQRVQEWIERNAEEINGSHTQSILVRKLMREVFGVTMEIQPARTIPATVTFS